MLKAVRHARRMSPQRAGHGAAVTEEARIDAAIGRASEAVMDHVLDLERAFYSTAKERIRGTGDMKHTARVMAGLVRKTVFPMLDLADELVGLLDAKLDVFQGLGEEAQKEQMDRWEQLDKKAPGKAEDWGPREFGAVREALVGMVGVSDRAFDSGVALFERYALLVKDDGWRGKMERAFYERMYECIAALKLEKDETGEYADPFGTSFGKVESFDDITTAASAMVTGLMGMLKLRMLASDLLLGGNKDERANTMNSVERDVGNVMKVAAFVLSVVDDNDTDLRGLLVDGVAKLTDIMERVKPICERWQESWGNMKKKREARNAIVPDSELTFERTFESGGISHSGYSPQQATGGLGSGISEHQLAWPDETRSRGNLLNSGLFGMASRNRFGAPIDVGGVRSVLNLALPLYDWGVTTLRTSVSELGPLLRRTRELYAIAHEPEAAEQDGNEGRKKSENEKASNKASKSDRSAKFARFLGQHGVPFVRYLGGKMSGALALSSDKSKEAADAIIREMASHRTQIDAIARQWCYEPAASESKQLIGGAEAVQVSPCKAYAAEISAMIDVSAAMMYGNGVSVSLRAHEILDASKALGFMSGIRNEMTSIHATPAVKQSLDRVDAMISKAMGEIEAYYVRKAKQLGDEVITNLGLNKMNGAKTNLSDMDRIRDEMDNFFSSVSRVRVKEMIKKAEGEIKAAENAKNAVPPNAAFFGASGWAHRASTKAKHAAVIRGTGARGAGYRVWLT
jgi:hypothetical protein